jgi:triacylglycerol lipase
MKGFKATDVKFSAGNALALGKAADLAYRSATVVKSTAAKWGMTANFFSGDVGIADTQAFVAKDASIVIVAFRGTETKEPKDFLTDADFAQVAVRPGGALRGLVHAGFQQALDAVWPSVEAAIRTACDANQTVWVTGHSLGAALATLATARLCAAGTNVSGLYTFGSPRAGNHDYAACFGKLAGARTFRFVNHRDIVPRVPPETFGKFSYKHVGQVEYFDKDGNLSGGPTIWDEIKDALSDLDWDSIMAGNPSRTQLLAKIKEPLGDHAMARYLEKLTALAKG